jgi:MoxR-like ATPase
MTEAGGPAPGRAPRPVPGSADEVLALLAAGDYVADRSLATALFLALRLGRPLFLEGEAGVGKTEVAKVLSRSLGRRLLRLQCYEGLDLASAAYEWDYPRQMMEIRLAEAAHDVDRARMEHDLFSARFLVKRPLLQALEPDPAGPPVLLIDEIDRTDEPFEAFLLEVLSDFQVTIPELGPVRAAAPPIVIVTSNRTREVHDALKRRCFYAWIDYPDASRELAIVRLKVPAAAERLAREVVGFVQRLRARDLFKIPGVAETLDWAQALVALDRASLDAEAVDATLGILLKYQDDLARVRGAAAEATLRDAVQEARAP